MYSTIQIASWFYCKKKEKQKYYKLSQLNQPNRNINLTETTQQCENKSSLVVLKQNRKLRN